MGMAGGWVGNWSRRVCESERERAPGKEWWSPDVCVFVCVFWECIKVCVWSRVEKWEIVVVVVRFGCPFYLVC